MKTLAEMEQCAKDYEDGEYNFKTLKTDRKTFWLTIHYSDFDGYRYFYDDDEITKIEAQNILNRF